MSEDIVDDYRRAGFHRRLGFGRRPALLVVDVCRAYFQRGSALDLDRPDVLEACGRLIDAARSSNVPVVWTRVEYEPGGADGGVFYRKVGALSSFDRGSELGEWVPGFEPEPLEEVVTKQYASAFFDTDLADRLRNLGIDTVVIGGVSTSGCVRASALDACQSGFVPIVVDEACGDRNVEVHRANLFDIDAKYGDVVSLADAVAALANQD